MAKYQFNEKETDQWLAKQPRKSIFAKAIIKSSDGRILLVKPNYKKSWQLPGGGVEAGEGPREGLIRELKEELNLDVDKANLKLVDTIFRQSIEHLILVYEFKLPLDEEQTIPYQEEELEGYKYEEAQKVGPQLSDYWSDFWRSYTTG